MGNYHAATVLLYSHSAACMGLIASWSSNIFCVHQTEFELLPRMRVGTDLPLGCIPICLGGRLNIDTLAWFLGVAS